MCRMCQVDSRFPVSKQMLDGCFAEGIYLGKLGRRRRVALPKEVEQYAGPRDPGNSRGESTMSPRPAYHELHWMHAPEYLFAMQISDAGQFFYESMNPAFERSLGISIGSERADQDCMSEEDAKSICAACDACLAKGRAVRYRHRLTLGGRRR